MRARRNKANQRSKVNKIYFILKHLLEKKMTCKKKNKKKKKKQEGQEIIL